MVATISRRQQADVPSGLSSLSPLMQRIFSARGVQCASELEDALSGLEQPDAMKGLDQALDRLVVAIENNQRILVVGDFDADGATSTAVSVKLLRQMGASSVSFLVPNRFTCGYGLTPALVVLAKKLKPDLIVTVDNGIASVEGVAAANAAGIDVVVTDHHLPGETLPDAVAIVNPNQVGCPFPSKSMAGVGVVYYLMIALRKRLQAMDWFNKKSIPVPNLAAVLDIVALGTVADVVPLDRNNRILVAQGLKRMRAGQACPGIKALFEVAGRQPQQVVAQDLGFALGPRLNAAGRLEDMSIGIACLLAETDQEAMQLATTLDELNRSRREIETDMSLQAFKAVEQLELDGKMPLGVCVHEPNWHQGVVGLVASRVKERLSRPVIAFAKDGEQYLKGSARSVPGVHVRDVLVRVAAAHPDLIEQFGGHAMAAGLKIKQSHYQRFSEAFAQAVAEDLREEDCQEVIASDGELTAGDMTLAFAEQLRFVVPWGQCFPEPVFDGCFELLSQRKVGENHLKLELLLAGDKRPIDAIWFRADVERWVHAEQQMVRIAFRMDVNHFRDRKRLQLMVLTMERSNA
jgi:single-stranded-DNA-specific exonuclease